MSSELMVAVIGLIGIIIGAIPTYVFMRQKSKAEIDKLIAETEKIRAETKALGSNRGRKFSATLKPALEFFIEKPFKFAAIRNNQYPIPSEFILWEKCSILLWAKVPKKGHGLRSSTNNKYLIGHMTDIADKQKGYPFFNRFSLGYLYESKVWAVTISSNSSSQKYLRISNGLYPGWHHFFIAWDRSKPILVFAIDAGVWGKQFTESLPGYWPDRVAESAILGSFALQHRTHYSETEMYKVEIYDQYLELESDTVKKHLNIRPR